MFSLEQKRVIIQISSLCSKIYCFPTDFDPAKGKLTVTKSVLKRSTILLSAIFSFVYMMFALVQTVILTKRGDFKYIIYQVMQVICQFLTGTFFWSSYKYKEELVSLVGYATWDTSGEQGVVSRKYIR
jgi:hypothetical protein